MRIFPFLVLLLFVSSNSIADIYQFKDEDGNILFSDVPVPGGKRIKQNKPSVAPAPNRKGVDSRNNVKNSDKAAQPASAGKTEAKPKAKKYTGLKITNPSDDQAIRSNNGNITFKYNLEPALQTKFGHYMKLEIDGKLIDKKWTSTSMSFKNMDRGTHTISAVVYDKNNAKLFKSKRTTFHLLRYSAILGR